MAGIKIGIGFSVGRTGLPSPQTIADFAERAEDLGIDSIWLSDRISSRQPHLDIACIMAGWAARTKKIKMGPSVLTLPARDPVHVARTYATLDYLSGSCGRIIMAVGLGSDPKECLACGIPPEERGPRMEEGVHVMRRLWTETRVTHHGRFYNFDDVTIEPRPARGSLDVWIGGRSDVALKRTARYGDGWFPSFITPLEFKSGMEKLQTYAAAHGRTVDRREAGVVLLTHVTNDHQRAAQLEQLVAATLPQAQGAGARLAIGSAAACIAKIQEYVDAGCTKFVLFPIAPPEELIGQIETFGNEVILHF
ncbi:MAG: LLM class flavin-dependent oxidoreductase [Deltaproteobacteria bacterium]|nr:LLM class flavin-dependent oxidoreductase [Deltaproteobacteria bacterium]